MHLSAKLVEVLIQESLIEALLQDNTSAGDPGDETCLRWGPESTVLLIQAAQGMAGLGSQGNCMEVSKGVCLTIALSLAAMRLLSGATQPDLIAQSCGWQPGSPIPSPFSFLCTSVYHFPIYYIAYLLVMFFYLLPIYFMRQGSLFYSLLYPRTRTVPGI